MCGDKVEKNNKGFTLIEIIATIGILLLIATITVPSVISIRNINKNKNAERIKDNILTAAKTYYYNKIELSKDSKCYTTLNNLVNNGYIKTPIINSDTNSEYPLTTIITIENKTFLGKSNTKFEIYDEPTITGVSFVMKRK